MYYKRLLGFFFSVTILVAVLSVVASSQQNPYSMVFILALPIVLTIGLLIFVLLRWRK